MFKIAICDDETVFAEKLGRMISAYLTGKGISCEIDIFDSGKELTAIGIRIAQYTAVFLDINMDGMDGIETAGKIRAISREVFIVFVTVHISYALEGYRLDAIRYLLKGESNFHAMVLECMDAMIDKLNFTIRKKEFEFREGRKEVLLERLLYIESRLHKLEFHVIEKTMKVYTMYRTLDELENMLGENNFVRIHKSYLVNLKHISNISRYKVKLTDGSELAVPKVRYVYVKDIFAQYQCEL
jgi:Response regulator of the LytR/AlgR family